MHTKGQGKKIRINDTDMYYERAGKVGEKPVLVFESGYGWPLENWDSIRTPLEEVTELFLYDRAGVGKSSKSEGPLHSLQSVQNLRELLQKAGVVPPYLLVGHSFGGVNVRLYAHLYPEETAGIVLLDSCHEDQNRKMLPLFTEQVQKEYLGQFTVEARLPEFEQSLEQVRGKKLGNAPLLVVTGGSQPHHTMQSMKVWLQFQQELAGLSSDSRQVVLQEAGHAVHIDQPEAVANLIEWMISAE